MVLGTFTPSFLQLPEWVHDKACIRTHFLPLTTGEVHFNDRLKQSTTFAIPTPTRS